MFSVIFPGQGSQAVGMGKEFYENYSIVKEIFSKANEVLKYDLTISKILINPSIFSSSKAVAGSSNINRSGFGKLDTFSRAKRIAIAAIVFSEPDPNSIGLASNLGCLIKISSFLSSASKKT